MEFAPVVNFVPIIFAEKAAPSGGLLTSVVVWACASVQSNGRHSSSSSRVVKARGERPCGASGLERRTGQQGQGEQCRGQSQARKAPAGKTTPATGSAGLGAGRYGGAPAIVPVGSPLPLVKSIGSLSPLALFPSPPPKPGSDSLPVAPMSGCSPLDTVIALLHRVHAAHRRGPGSPKPRHHR